MSVIRSKPFDDCHWLHCSLPFQWTDISTHGPIGQTAQSRAQPEIRLVNVLAQNLVMEAANAVANLTKGGTVL